jgi:hypothetical protein
VKCCAGKEKDGKEKKVSKDRKDNRLNTKGQNAYLKNW